MGERRIVEAEGPGLTAAYEERLAKDPSSRFRWSPALLSEVRTALALLTQEHGAYCDGGLSRRPEPKDRGPLPAQVTP